jgi:hypothetical protein
VRVHSVRLAHVAPQPLDPLARTVRKELSLEKVQTLTNACLQILCVHL